MCPRSTTTDCHNIKDRMSNLGPIQLMGIPQLLRIDQTTTLVFDGYIIVSPRDLILTTVLIYYHQLLA